MLFLSGRLIPIVAKSYKVIGEDTHRVYLTADSASKEPFGVMSLILGTRLLAAHFRHFPSHGGKTPQ